MIGRVCSEAGRWGRIRPTWPERLRWRPGQGSGGCPAGKAGWLLLVRKASCLPWLQGLRSSSQHVLLLGMSLLPEKGLGLVVTTLGGLSSFDSTHSSALSFSLRACPPRTIICSLLLSSVGAHVGSTLEPHPSLAPSSSSSQLCAFVPRLQPTGPFQGRHQPLSLPCPTPARCLLTLRTKSTSHVTPSTHLLGLPASTALPSSWASTSPGPFTQLPLECPVPVLCTATVASLGPGHSAHHSPRPTLCPVFAEHSLCFGPVHSRMCAS